MKTFKTLSLAALVFGLGVAAQAGSDDNRSMTVYKTPWCGCCEAWSNAMADAGFAVKTVDLEDLTAIKKQASVTEALEGCHTAVFGDYILEGHVPLQAIAKLLSERPDIRGLATPGMPSGALGMGDDEDTRYTVYAFYSDTSKKPTVFYEAGL